MGKGIDIRNGGIRTRILKTEKLSHISILQAFKIDDDYCGTHNFNRPISSTINNIVANAVKTYDDTLLTSIAVTSTFHYTVALVGTSTGLIRKVRTYKTF